MTLLSVAEAQARLLASVQPLGVETLSLPLAAGRWAAAEVAALRTQPSADLSAMDGYAIRFTDLPGPWRVVGESAAGRSMAGAIGPGEAARIFTGAALPAGADTVLVQEEAGRDGPTLRLTGEGPPRARSSVRPRGLDFEQGDLLIAAGERLTPARIALAAAGGHDALPVHRRVRVAMAATGDELVEPGSPVDTAKLPEANRAMLAAQLADLPVDLIDLGILPDDLTTLRDAFAGVEADLLVTSGGVSVGDHDLIRPALVAAGGAIDFWRTALRPGKPMLAGRLGRAAVLGLPGNPVSAFVTALLFVRPLVARLAGAADPLPRTRAGVLGEDLPANPGRAEYLRAVERDGRLYPAPVQDSSMLSTLARATCLILRPSGAAPAKAGDSAEILDLA